MGIAKTILVLLAITAVILIAVYQPMFFEALLLGFSVLFTRTLSVLHWLVPNWGAAFFGFASVFMGMMVMSLCAINRETGLREKIARLNNYIDRQERELRQRQDQLANKQGELDLTIAKLRASEIEVKKLKENKSFMTTGFTLLKENIGESFEQINKDMGKALMDMLQMNETLSKRVRQLETGTNVNRLG